MKRLTLVALWLAVGCLPGGCATIPQAAGPRAAQPFKVVQFELLTIEYTSPTTVDAIDANGPAAKIFDCGHAGLAGTAQEPQFRKGSPARYVPTCIPLVFSGPMLHGAVAVQPAAQNARILFWASEALDWDLHGKFVKGAQPEGPFASSALCAAQSQREIKQSYIDGKVAKTDSLVIWCVPIPRFGEQADGSGTVEFHITPYADPCPQWPSPGSGPCEIVIRMRL